MEFTGRVDSPCVLAVSLLLSKAREKSPMGHSGENTSSVYSAHRELPPTVTVTQPIRGSGEDGWEIMQVSEALIDSLAGTLLLASEGFKLWAQNDRKQSQEFSFLVISFLLYTQPLPSGKREFR